MTNRPKQIGTAGETAIVRYLNTNGFPHAERRALRGIKDVGDITGTPGIVWESKAGHAAWDASDNLIEAWLAETDLERANAHEFLGVLVVARRQKNVRDWWAVMGSDQISWLMTGAEDTLHPPVPVRTTLAHAVNLMREAGWGSPSETADDFGGAA